jgi:hypothetical protein
MNNHRLVETKASYPLMLAVLVEELNAKPYYF